MTGINYVCHMTPMIEQLLILGCGYVGEHFGRAAAECGIRVYGTTRSAVRADALRRIGIRPLLIADITEIPDAVLTGCDAVVDSVPLERTASGLLVPQQAWLAQLAPKLAHIRWAGYLSTSGVYGDAGGAWVDEDTPCHPSSARGVLRLQAERLWRNCGLPVEVFRLAGIYGPRRTVVPRLMAGNYKAVAWSPPRWSNRIHVDDIVAALMAAMQQPVAGRTLNLADDAPLPHAEYVCELAGLVGAPAPQLLTPEEAEQQLSPAALDFFRDNKRISNRRLHAELLPQLCYPDFRAFFAPSQS